MNYLLLKPYDVINYIQPQTDREIALLSAIEYYIDLAYDKKLGLREEEDYDLEIQDLEDELEYTEKLLYDAQKTVLELTNRLSKYEPPINQEEL